MGYRRIKRGLDIFFSVILLILLFPLLIIISVLILIDSKKPIFFLQDRIGEKGNVFKMIKFRTMVVGAEKGGVYEFKNDKRITKVGKFLRKTSLDELPQLVNILKGEMSFIGPRPVLTYHPFRFEEYNKIQRKRFEVKPGITGLAQIKGRKEIDWNKRFEYDIYYVENLSLILDFKILMQTILNVLLMKDNLNVNKTV
ncbi:MAG: sugar transferase [candidate division WOR-3 bacterium]|jgi:lipopolysaccharide/colanic/teichoic acid biosynthesis glycosyltransferase